jgi:hypothetical protein
MTDKAWIDIEEAITEVMKRKNCSRRTARRLIAARVKDKSVSIRRVPGKSPFPKLDPKEAIRRIESGEEDNVLLTLADVMRYFKLTPDETLIELQAGRLIASSTESVRLEMELDDGYVVRPETFMVTYAAIMDWLVHPNTPRQLIVRRTGN